MRKPTAWTGGARRCSKPRSWSARGARGWRRIAGFWKRIRRARPSPSSTRSFATSRNWRSATSCMCSAACLTMRAARSWRGSSRRPAGLSADSEHHLAAQIEASAKVGACGVAGGARWAPRCAGAGRCADARPCRRAADGAQSHHHGSACHSDAHRGHRRRARRERDRAALSAGSRRLSEGDRARPVGLGVAAHGRRRSRAGAQLSRRAADVGRGLAARDGRRGHSGAEAGAAAHRRDAQNFRTVPRYLRQPDRAVRHGCRAGGGARRGRGVEPAGGRTAARRKPRSRVRCGAGCLWRGCRVGRARRSGERSGRYRRGLSR